MQTYRPDTRPPMRLIDMAETLAMLREKGGLRHVEIAELINVRPETISRWTQGRSRIPQARVGRRLMELEYVVDEVAELLPPDGARRFLCAPQDALAGEIPIDLMRADRTHEVLRVLSQMRLSTERSKQARKRDRSGSAASLPPPEPGWRSPLLNPPKPVDER